MPLEVGNKFISPGYPMTCPCGEPTPCEAVVDEFGYQVVTCDKCGRSWTYYELVGWSQDSDARETAAERDARETRELKEALEVYLR